MKIEVDPSDLEWGTIYKDEKCKELERVLQSDSKHAGCEVKRVHWGEENTNSFYVFDESGEPIVELERWEVDALNGAELITYIEVQRKRDQFTDWLDPMLLGLFGAVVFSGVVVSVLEYLLQPSVFSQVWLMIPNLVWVYLLLLLLATLGFLKYRSIEQQKKNIDLEAAKDDPLFCGVLKKLADISETENPSKKDFVKRLEYIEDAFAGIN